MAAYAVREVYVEDGVFDRGPKLEGAYGVDAIASFTLKPEHKEAIQGGLAHIAGLPLIDLRGDQAIVTSYLQILCLDHQGEPRELPNHGVSQGYRIHRVVANRWQLVKTKGEWMIKTRTIVPIDGSSEPLEILSQGLNDVLKSRQKKQCTRVIGRELHERQQSIDSGSIRKHCTGRLVHEVQ